MLSRGVRPPESKFMGSKVSIRSKPNCGMLRDKVASVVFQGQTKVLLNLAGVNYMDSGGLGELVRCSMAARKANGAVKLANLTSRITDLLTITKLLTVFDTYDSEEKALASF